MLLNFINCDHFPRYYFHKVFLPYDDIFFWKQPIFSSLKGIRKGDKSSKKIGIIKQKIGLSYMSKVVKVCPQCIYGNQCHMICINSSCRKPAFICENGLKTKTECALFHDKCEKMLWSQLENIICQNPNTKIPQLFAMQEEMEQLFTTLIKKVKEQHQHFKKWISHFGFNTETLSFINMVNEQSYNNVSGAYINQILSGLFMNQQKSLETCFSEVECKKTLKQIESMLDKVKQLYLIDSKKDKMLSVSTTVSNSYDIPGLSSYIINDHQYLRSLFPKKSIKGVSLLYRASENNFSAFEFHKICDNIPQTITLIETQYGKIIGGYTPLAWNSSKKHWAPDKTMGSFIFSFDLKEKFTLNLAQFAIACNPEKGPIFGCCDICVVDKSNIQKSNAEFPISYNNFKYARNPQSSEAFTGHAKGRFTTKEWEVFKIDFYE